MKSLIIIGLYALYTTALNFCHKGKNGRLETTSARSSLPLFLFEQVVKTIKRRLLTISSLEEITVYTHSFNPIFKLNLFRF